MEQLGNESTPCASVAAGDIKMHIFMNKHRYLTTYKYDSNEIEKRYFVCDGIRTIPYERLFFILT
jgi:hypothetical protein